MDYFLVMHASDCRALLSSTVRCDAILWQRASALLRARLKAMPDDDQVALEALRAHATASSRSSSSSTSRSSSGSVSNSGSLSGSGISSTSSNFHSGLPSSPSISIRASRPGNSEVIVAQHFGKRAAPKDSGDRQKQEDGNSIACSGLAASHAVLERHTDDEGHGDVCRIPATYGFACPNISTAAPLHRLDSTTEMQVDSRSSLSSMNSAACERVPRKPFCVMPSVESGEGVEAELPCRVGKGSHSSRTDGTQREQKKTTPPPNVIHEVQLEMNYAPTPAAVAAVRSSFVANESAALPLSAAFVAPAEADNPENSTDSESAPRKVHTDPLLNPAQIQSQQPKPHLRNGNKFFGGFFFSD